MQTWKIDKVTRHRIGCGGNDTVNDWRGVAVTEG